MITEKNIIKLVFIIFSLCSFYGCKEEYQVEIASRYSDGSTMKIYHVVYHKNEKSVIKEIRFYPNGEKEFECEIKNWKPNGKKIYWYSNRQKKLEEKYVKGVKHGSFTEYFMSGEINYEGEYENGIPSGKWKFYDGNGNVDKIIKYKNGLLVK